MSSSFSQKMYIMMGNDDNENESEYKENMIVERYSYSLIVQFIKHM